MNKKTLDLFLSSLAAMGGVDGVAAATEAEQRAVIADLTKKRDAASHAASLFHLRQLAQV